MYGVTPSEHSQVREVRCIVMMPQIATYQSCTLPKYIPDHPVLKEMEPLGWIHTQPSETGHLSPFDAALHCKLLNNHSNWSSKTAMVGTVSFTQGSCSLSLYGLTEEGLEWGEKNQEGVPNPEGFTENCF
jgi:pre-mRNA-processing factor 8